MKRVLIFLCTMMLALSFTIPVQADTVTVPFDLGDNDWDHWQVYYYAINLVIPDGYDVTAARVELEDVVNWNDDDSVIYAGILSNEYPTSFPTPRDEGDNQNIFYNDIEDDALAPYLYEHLFTYPMTDDSTYDIYYDLDDSEVIKLDTWLKADALAAIAFDPDCHFDFTSRTFSITYESGGNGQEVPEPTTMLLLGTGLVGLAGFRRKFRK